MYNALHYNNTKCAVYIHGTSSHAIIPVMYASCAYSVRIIINLCDIKLLAIIYKNNFSVHYSMEMYYINWCIDE